MARFTAPKAVEVYDPFTLTCEPLEAIPSPFTEGILSGHVTTPDGAEIAIRGFCDRADGAVFRLRFLPTAPGVHRYRARFVTGDATHEVEGEFEVGPNPAKKGLLKADGWGFRWSGTGEPFFWNATTAYLLPGLDEPLALQAIDRLASKGVNRLRVTLCATRQKNGLRWSEPAVSPRADFTFHYAPWPAGQPESQEDPQFDTSRFDVAHFQKFERLVDEARKKDIVVQVIFYTDAQEPQNFPFDREAGGHDPAEHRYVRYLIARLAAFSNVEWCVTNEWALYRPDESVEVIGALVAAEDPYGHLTSVHGHGHFPFRASPWVTHALYQSWDEAGGYDFILAMREEQTKLGRPIPIVNDEYGYEDHYPVPWGGGKVAPARSSDNRRRLAWEITMAGGHQTTGEASANGLGGWINGLGDETMVMLDGFRHMRTFFEGFAFDRLTPVPERTPKPNLVLEEEGVRLVVYVPEGGQLPEGLAEAGDTVLGFNPRTGGYFDRFDGLGDWVFRVEKAR